jgi:hypothetical protein
MSAARWCRAHEKAEAATLRLQQSKLHNAKLYLRRFWQNEAKMLNLFNAGKSRRQIISALDWMN